MVQLDDRSERDVRLLNTESEEADGRLGQDRRRHQQRRVDDDDTDGVRQDVREHDAPAGGAGNTCRVDELAFTQGENFASNQSR